ncbi:MAG: prephenate dehydratase [Selenomonadaceae bacterium]|nr:prephenate dehydratase [Selenomonadaceae bacterium]MBR1730756.1 prephenate dehydratase [Selenomonadaceae bacterium]
MKLMGILGPRGTHSEAAAVYLNEIIDEPLELIIYQEIYDVLIAVENGEVNAGFVPVENSLEGSVNITLDTLARSDNLIVTRELIWSVHNHLMTKPGVDASQIKKIFSHSQPISQCRKYLQKNFSTAKTFTTSSTAKAAEIVAESKISDGYAAICTKRAGELNNLVTIADEIQDNMLNSTRFFEIRRRNEDFQIDSPKDKILIICQIDGEHAGALCEVLEEFAFRNVNMTRIESRPARTKLGEYIFFFDLDTNIDQNILNESIAAVKQKSIWLKNLGSFPVIIANNK